VKSAAPNPLRGWQVDRASIRTIGHDLQRPECILAERDGTLWAADARGGVMRIAPGGSQQLVTPYVEGPSPEATSFENRYVQAQGSLPNGLAFAENGDFIIANWGTDAVDEAAQHENRRRLCCADR
jgi:hypothetical protein